MPQCSFACEWSDEATCDVRCDGHHRAAGGPVARPHSRREVQAVCRSADFQIGVLVPVMDRAELESSTPGAAFEVMSFLEDRRGFCIVTL